MFRIVFIIAFIYTTYATATVFASSETIVTTSVQPELGQGVLLFEESAQALAAAAKEGLRGATVLHIDNSDNLWPIPTDSQIADALQLLETGNIKDLETSGRILTPGVKRLYSFANYLVMAHRLGIIKEVYWAVPSLEALDVERMQAIMHYPENRSTPFAPNLGTKLDISMPHIKGTISGVPITIGLLRHYKKTASPLWVDVELDFFSELYKNPISSSYLGLLSGFVSAMQKLELEPNLLTLSYSNSDGQVPIRSRYAGNWLKTLLNEPQALNDKPPTEWQMKEEALYQEFFVQFDEAITAYGQLLRETPEDADAHYSLAMLLLKKGDVSQATRSLKRAASLDPVYSLGALDALNGLPTSARDDYLLELRTTSFLLNESSPLPLRLAASEAQTENNHLRAVQHLKQLIASGDDSPVVLAMLADSLEISGSVNEAITTYQQAVALIRTYPTPLHIPKLWTRLGKALEEKGLQQDAREIYQEYLKLFPDEPSENIKEALKRLQTPQTTN